MSCVDLQYISSDECIGASLPKINGNFAALSAAVCGLSSVPAVDASISVFDSPTIDLNWNASTRTLSAVTTEMVATSSSPMVAKAWACFSYSTTTGLTAHSSFNISSISPLGSGRFLLYFITPMSDRKYTVHVGGASQVAASLMHVQNADSNDMSSIPSIRTPDSNNNNNPYKGTDGIKIGGDGTDNWSEVYFTVYGN